MKPRIKVLLYYILEFLLTIVLLGTITIFLVKSTLLSSNFIKNEFVKADYYNELYTSIKEEMLNHVSQAGFDESIIDNIYTKEMLKNSVEKMIDSTYSNKKYTIDLTEVKENLEKNINKYLEINNIKITDQKALDKFIQNILKIYEDEITLSNTISHVEKIVSKIKNLVNIVLLITVIFIIILILIIKFMFKDTALAIPTIAVGVILFFAYLLITGNVIIENLYIWDNSVSSLIQHLLNTLLNKIRIYGLLLLIIGCIDTLIMYILSNLKKINLKS